MLTVPKNFSIDSFVPNPGWHRVLQQTGAGENAVVQKVTWTGGHVPTGEDSLFQFLAQPASPGTYTFAVQQTYSDGSIVDWNGSESSEAPAPTIDAVRSLNGDSSGGGVSVLSIVAIVLAALALLASVAALVGARGRGTPAGVSARGRIGRGGLAALRSPRWRCCCRPRHPRTRT